MAERQNNKQIIIRMENVLDVLEKMEEDTKTLQNAMRTQEDQISGDRIMSKAMDLLCEINNTVRRMQEYAGETAESIREGAEDMIRVQTEGARAISNI